MLVLVTGELFLFTFAALCPKQSRLSVYYFFFFGQEYTNMVVLCTSIGKISFSDADK